MADDIDYFCNNCKEWYLTEGKCPECGKELVPWTIWTRTTAK